jgi:dolichol kinase
MVAPPLPLSAALQFLFIVGVVLGGVVYPWSSVLLDTWNPVGWLVEFLVEKPARGYLILYWALCLVVCVPAFAVLSNALALPQIIARKLFHALVVVMFVPAFFYSPEMLSLSYGVAFAVFCLAECMRAVALPLFGQQIAQFVQPFIDHREGGRVILTHTYLLLGCALPLWLAHSAAASNAFAANAGVLALGVGDAMGAAVGSTFGKQKIFGRKTVEGTAAVLISTVIASLALHDYHWNALSKGEPARVITKSLENAQVAHGALTYLWCVVVPVARGRRDPHKSTGGCYSTDR